MHRANKRRAERVGWKNGDGKKLNCLDCFCFSTCASLPRGLTHVNRGKATHEKRSSSANIAIYVSVNELRLFTITRNGKRSFLRERKTIIIRFEVMTPTISGSKKSFDMRMAEENSRQSKRCDSLRTLSSTVFFVETSQH